MHHIGVSLNQMKVLGERLLILLALLERMKHQRLLDLPLSAHKESDLRDPMDFVNIPLRLNGSRQFQHRLLPHPVAKVVSLAPLQYGRNKFIFPIVIMGKPTERGLDSPDDDRNIGIEFF